MSTCNQNGSGNYVNIPSTSNYIQNTNLSAHTTSRGSTEYLTKVNNTTPTRTNSNSSSHQNVTAYDRYPKPGTYGGLQIYPMTGVNTEINNGSANSSPMHKKTNESSPAYSSNRNQFFEQKRNVNNTDNDCLEDMLKICTEYSDRQNQSCNSITSSPIVQNRIKTNGSLPREKKSPFHHEQHLTTSNSNLNTKTYNGVISTSSGYENVRLVGQNRVEINGQVLNSSSPKTGYENVVIGKYVPQSPRTKIRTTCMSPKKEHSFNSSFSQATPTPLPQAKTYKQHEYEQLIKTFEEKLKLEMQAIEESSRYQPSKLAKTNSSAEQSPIKRTNKNINNLTLNLKQASSLQNSPKLSKKPAPAPRTLSKASSDSVKSLQNIEVKPTLNHSMQHDECIKILENADIEQLKTARKEMLIRTQTLKNEISDVQKQEDEVLRELDMEKALVTAELSSMGDSVGELDNELKVLQNKIHRLEAQRNATRVMEENQQAKLKQSIEMKQDQVKKLKAMLKQKPNNACLKEEIHNVCESLENDRKTFEDLEFQYLEEESEWHAYREELSAEEKDLSIKIEGKRIELQHLEKQDLTNQNYATSDAKVLKNKLSSLVNELKLNQERLKTIDNSICDITGQLQINSSDEDEIIDNKLTTSTKSAPTQSNLVSGVMSQSLFGSAEILCPKRTTDDIMSKSVNENMFYNNRIELPTANATSTPKRTQLQVVDIHENELQHTADKPPKSPRTQTDALLRLKYNVNGSDERVKFNLSLGSDDFEVNPLEKRVPSQDDIDRICKVTLDAPISTKGASNKIFDSIKEIERNRQLLLAQQGHHVIEHERQKMHDLKKKSHDEARAQYISMLNNSVDGSNISNTTNSQAQKPTAVELQKLKAESENITQMHAESQNIKGENKDQNGEVKNQENTEDITSQQRRSQPEFGTQQRQQLSRPLSEANSELSCDLLNDNNNCKSSIELSTNTSGIGSTGNRYSGEQAANADDAADKRGSVNSNETTSAGSGGGSNSSHSERKRALPKHQRPLTRYLPIFSPDLNLRLHIESAGHQIALCPHVFVDAHSCRGYLHKLGATFHGWARRWFVLDRQRNAFIYYSDKSERKPRGGAYFSTIDEVYLDHLNASKSGRPHCTFIVKTKKRSYHLQAASDAAARIWIDAIITGAQGNLDY